MPASRLVKQSTVLKIVLELILLDVRSSASAGGWLWLPGTYARDVWRRLKLHVEVPSCRLLIPRMAIGDRMSRFHATERLCLTLWLKAFLFLFNVRRVAKSISLIEITVKCFASLVEKYYGWTHVESAVKTAMTKILCFLILSPNISKLISSVQVHSYISSCSITINIFQIQRQHTIVYWNS